MTKWKPAMPGAKNFTKKPRGPYKLHTEFFARDRAVDFRFLMRALLAFLVANLVGSFILTCVIAAADTEPVLDFSTTFAIFLMVFPVMTIIPAVILSIFSAKMNGIGPKPYVITGAFIGPLLLGLYVFLVGVTGEGFNAVFQLCGISGFVGAATAYVFWLIIER